MTDRPNDRLVSPPARASARKRANTAPETRRETDTEEAPSDNSQTARDPPPTTEKPTVIIPSNEFTLPKVLRLLEAGNIVLVVPASNNPE